MTSLTVTLPLPPPDNQCHRTGQMRRYATREYRDWLDVAAPLLRVALIETELSEPDRTHWWCVKIQLRLPVRAGDAQNYIKPLLDLLSGAQLDRDGQRIVKPGALWNDDCRVFQLHLDVCQTHVPAGEGAAFINATPLEDAPERYVRPKASRAGRKET